MSRALHQSLLIESASDGRTYPSREASAFTEGGGLAHDQGGAVAGGRPSPEEAWNR